MRIKKRLNKTRVFIALTILILLMDRITKFFALNIKDSIPIINNVFHLTLSKNTGGGFSLFQGQKIFLIIISIIVIIAILYYYNKVSKKFNIAFAFVLAGTLGNLIDRLYFSYVIDFIDLRIWPIFNIADISLTIGAIILIYRVIFFKEKNVKTK